MRKQGGLSSEEAMRRLKQFGRNELSGRPYGHWLENARKVMLDPMGLMLLALGFTYLALGQITDGLVLFLAYIPIVGVDVLLELRSQKALRALKQTIRSHCHVIRDNKTVQIAVREIVPGDWVVLEEGHAIAADGRLVDVSNLSVDESALTGESVPVAKIVGDEVLSGTTVLTGGGIFETEKTGPSSQIGSIGKMLEQFAESPSPLLVSIQKAVKVFFGIAVIIAAIVFAWSLHRGESFSGALITSLTLAMAAIPEEFPLVFTIYLSLAAYRLSKKGILVKSLTAIEGLGRADVICTDKTGTLTEGQFRLEKIIPFSGAGMKRDPVPLILACELKAVDAMEAAIFAYAHKLGGDGLSSRLHDEWNLIYDYPFDPAQKYMSHVWRNLRTGEEVLAMKGAVEGVLGHCEGSDRAQIEERAKSESQNGMRLLGLAFKKGQFTGDRASDEQGLQFLGILSFSDPVRPDVAEALKWCRQRNIDVKMLTGDHLLTAHSIADRIGLPHSHDQLHDGPSLDRLSASARASAFVSGHIFARLRPEQKLELVQSLKKSGSVVAMTGDGINDGPALKLADVGISMGEKATDVARSSAQLVLLKSRFSGIVDAVLEGERVFQSLRQSFGYLIAFHLPIILIAVLQAFAFDEPLFLPLHIILLELVVHPVSAFAFDGELSRGPSSRENSLISAQTVFWSLIRGTLLTAAAVVAFIYMPGSIEFRRGFAVTLIVLGNIGLVLGEKNALRFATENIFVVGALTGLGIILSQFSTSAGLLHLAPIGIESFCLAWLAGVALSFFRPLPQ